MERRLTRQGPAGRKSYTVTLPKQWVQDHGLDTQRDVELTQTGDAIIVTAPEETREKTVNGDAHTPDSLAKALSLQYRLGADTITVEHTEPETYNAVKQIVQNRLMGFEILEQEEGTVTLKDFSKERGEAFEPVLRRLFRQVMRMAEHAVDENREHIMQLEDSVNRLSNYARRLLIKQGHSKYRKTPLYYSLIQELERQGDDIKHRGTLTEEVETLFQDLYSFMYHGEPELATVLQRLDEETSARDTVRQRLSGMAGVIYGIKTCSDTAPALQG